MIYTRIQLTNGWTFKQQEWPTEEWLPVSQAPSQIHMDLLAHKKYYMQTVLLMTQNNH